ncbi:histidine kinase, partial [Sphingomonas sp. BHC-A]
AADFPAGAVLDVRVGDGDVGLLADDLDRYDIPYLFCTGAFAHPALDAHPGAPLVPKWALSRQLIDALRQIVH